MPLLQYSFRHSLYAFCLAVCAIFFTQNFAAPAAAQISANAEKCAPNSDSARLQRLKAARKGAFRFLRIAEEPLYLGALQFRDEQDNSKSFADFSGKMLLINLWGVWCPPCRAEIPDLAELQTKMGGENFAVLTLYDHASNKERVRAFLAEKQAENLPLYRDPDMDIYNALKREGLARGLPVSLLTDARGCLIASLSGGAPWASDDALAFIKAAQQ